MAGIRAKGRSQIPTVDRANERNNKDEAENI